MKMAAGNELAHLARVGITPTDFARSFGRAPILVTTTQCWNDVLVQRFDLPEFPNVELNLDGSYMHRITLHLAGRVAIKRRRDGRIDSRCSGGGCSSFVPAGVPTSRSFRGHADFATIHLAPDVLDEVAAECLGRPTGAARLLESFALEDATLNHLFKLLLLEAETNGMGTRLFTDALIRALALHLLRTYAGTAWQSRTQMGGIADWRLRRAIDYMHAHLAENVSLRCVAGAAGLSVSHFTRAFRHTTGLPPHQYLLRLRIQQAKDLLAHSRMQITEVGFRCGFERSTHFATMFRRAVGMSPRAYRSARSSGVQLTED